MANGRIDVYFHAGDGEKESSEETGKGQDGENTSTKSGTKSTARSAIATMALNYAKKSASYGLSIYGDLTGDYVAQNKMSNAVNLVTTGIMMANFPVGTIAGAFSIATQTASFIISTERQRRQTNLIRERTGNETINNSEE